MKMRSKNAPRMFGAGGVVATYKPLFAGEGLAMAVLSALSFVGGLAEAGLLYSLAKLAFAIGGDATKQAAFGPLGSIHFTVAMLFWVSFGLGVLRTLANTGAAHMTAAIAARRTTELRADTYADYARAAWSKQSTMDEAGVQDLLLRYVGKVVGAVSVVASGLPALFSLIALVGVAIVVDPLSAALVVATGLVLFFGLRPLSALAKRYSTLQRDAGQRYIERSKEVIGLSLEIRAFGVNEQVVSDLAEYSELEARPVYVNLFLTRLVSTLYQFAAIVIVLFGLLSVYLFLDRPLASLSAIVVILVRAMSQASTLQSIYHSTVETASFAERLSEVRGEFLASEAASGTELLAPRADLQFDAVTYCYPGAPTPALDQVSFTLAAGEAVGVVGPSGSGKSTVIQILLRLREPTEGRFLLQGVDSRLLDDDAWFRQIAFVPQDSRVINASIADNIAFFRPYLTREHLIDAARRANLHDEIVAMPEGYDTMLGFRGGALSGGQRQRVALARALACDPQIVVLDEPTSALDMHSESLVQKTLAEMQGRVTLLIIAHRMSTLRTCDRIMVLGDGRLQHFGSRTELESSSSFYRDAIALSKLRS
jgi:ATP-binding cassette subfamily B protein